jgi:hypothetical protein
MEKQLFGHGHSSGINFEKYDDIPVEGNQSDSSFFLALVLYILHALLLLFLIFISQFMHYINSLMQHLVVTSQKPSATLTSPKWTNS